MGIIGSVGASLATSFGWLLFSRALAGATAAAIIPLSMAWIGDTVVIRAPAVHPRAILSGQILGIIGGQLIGGFFADTLGWPWSFVFLTAEGLVTRLGERGLALGGRLLLASAFVLLFLATN
jgi:MFS transporter, YNFM family, putative membrane transport protein